MYIVVIKDTFIVGHTIPMLPHSRQETLPLGPFLFGIVSRLANRDHNTKSHTFLLCWQSVWTKKMGANSSLSFPFLRFIRVPLQAKMCAAGHSQKNCVLLCCQGTIVHSMGPFIDWCPVVVGGCPMRTDYTDRITRRPWKIGWSSRLL